MQANYLYGTIMQYYKIDSFDQQFYQQIALIQKVLQWRATQYMKAYHDLSIYQ